MVISDWNLTLDQFLDLPEATPALECDPPCNGQGATVRQKMSPSEAHSALQAAFVYLLRPLRDRDLRIRTELRIVSRHRARVPVYALADLAPRALRRRPRITPPPQIAIEIRPSDEDLSVQLDRCRVYVDEWGCPPALLVDPESAEAEVLAFRPTDDSRVPRRPTGRGARRTS